MITLHSLEEASAALGAAGAGGTTLTWGTFDGMHRGHQALIAAARARANALGLPLLALTFEPRPAVFFNPAGAPRSLADLEDRLAILAGLGVDYSLVLPFERGLAAMAAEDFLRGLVLDRLKARSLVLGYDLSFGSRGLGDYEFLRSRAESYGFSLEIIEPLRLMPEGRVISSTWVRERLAAGDLAGLPPLLGRQHSVHGRVLHGCRRGHDLGFATANLDPGPLLLPPPGIYACLAAGAAMQGKAAGAACNLGTNPSFGNGKVSLEAHLLDFSGDIYGQDLRLYFIKKLRTETAFPGPADLARQIGLDVRQTREILGAARRDPAFAELYPL
ncbi:MAG: riboflavin biosynthesis protein RibF [Deltaproteobacteria bacterium]|jgi:riboflavin kinase/FMN adenylyltransferase|nr:riboflavin biosynthesis protein RibF [Deltaproteobacteria bacterium]